VPPLIIIAKIMLITVALTFASFQDLRTREIDDKVWIYTVPVGALLTVYEALTTQGYPLVLAGLSVVLTAVIALGIFYTGLFGGADAKALIALAAALPLPPYQNFASPFYPLTVLGNGLILSLLLIPACLSWNFIFAIKTKGKNGALFEGIRATRAQKFVAILTGVRVKPATAGLVHFNLMERVSADGEHVLKFFHKVEEREGSKLIDPRSRAVWVTPAIPMIVFFLAGFLLSFAVGDIIFQAVALVLGVV